MGLVKAALGAASGVMGDQWKEYFYCSALPAEVLAVKGQKKVSGRSSNRHGTENIITDGSIVAVAEGQCALIVEQGKVVDLCAEAGEYTYNTGTQPSLLSEGLAKNIDEVFAEIGKRFSFGGQAATDQRIYYINTKELMGNKYGTPSPVPFRVVDQRAGIDIDVSIRCFGEYSYRIVNPILFYTNVCGNVENEYTRDALEGQMRTEMMTALQPAFAQRDGHPLLGSARPYHRAGRGPESGAVRQVEQAARHRDRLPRRVRRQSQRRRRADDQGAAAQRRLYGPDPRRRPHGGRTGFGDAGGGFQYLRRPGHGLYGHESGRCCRRHQRPGPLPDGRTAAACRCSCPRSRPGGWQLELLLRPDRQHRQVLHRLRQAPPRSRLGVQLRRTQYRQILLGVR